MWRGHRVLNGAFDTKSLLRSSATGNNRTETGDWNCGQYAVAGAVFDSLSVEFRRQQERIQDGVTNQRVLVTSRGSVGGIIPGAGCSQNPTFQAMVFADGPISGLLNRLPTGQTDRSSRFSDPERSMLHGPNLHADHRPGAGDDDFFKCNFYVLFIKVMLRNVRRLKPN